MDRARARRLVDEALARNPAFESPSGLTPSSLRRFLVEPQELGGGRWLVLTLNLPTAPGLGIALDDGGWIVVERRPDGSVVEHARVASFVEALQEM